MNCLSRGIFVGPLKNHLQVGEYLSPGDSIRDPTWSTILGGHLNKQKTPISQPKTKNMFKNGSTSAIRFSRENFESHPGETAFRFPLVEFPQHIRSFLDTAMQKTSKSWNAGFGHQEGKPLQKQVTTWCQFQRFVISMEFPGSLNRWYWYILTQLAIYKRYISGIYCQLGDYIYIYITYHLLREPETAIVICSPPQKKIRNHPGRSAGRWQFWKPKFLPSCLFWDGELKMWLTIRKVAKVYFQLELHLAYAPGKLKWNLKMIPFPKEISIFLRSMFRFHVSFRRCRFASWKCCLQKYQKWYAPCSMVMFHGDESLIP